MIKAKKGLMGSYKEDDSLNYTHCILEKDDYDALISENRHLQRKSNDYQSNYIEESNKYKKLMEEYRSLVNKYNSIAEKARVLFSKYKTQEIQLEEYRKANEDLIRVHREKSNSQRSLIPKKEHSGYLFISGKRVKFKFFEVFKDKNCFLYKFQTPYDICLPYDLVMKRVDSDLRERVLKDLNVDIDKVRFMGNVDAFVNSKAEKKGDYIKGIWENNNELFIFNFKINQNGAKGFWEIEFNSRDEIIINNSVLMIRSEVKKD